MTVRSPGESESQKQEAAGQVPGAGGGAGDRASPQDTVSVGCDAELCGRMVVMAAQECDSIYYH